MFDRLRESRRAEVQAIGSDAVNQAIKAVAVARGYLEQDAIDVICIPTFVDVEPGLITSNRTMMHPFTCMTIS